VSKIPSVVLVSVLVALAACATSTVAHATSYTIGGTVSGLSAGVSITLFLNDAYETTVTGSGSFTFSDGALTSGLPYAVAIGTQPPWETCAVSNGTGTVGSANVTNVSVTCPAGAAVGTYAVSGTVSGLGTGAFLNLLNSGVYVSTIVANGSFTFSMPLASGDSYSVTIGAQPTGENCTVSNGAGTVSPSNQVTDVSVTCSSGGSIPVPSSIRPGARAATISWNDAFGNLWLFGGQGYGSTGTMGFFNDLWEFSTSTAAGNAWAWVSGLTVLNTEGRFGAKGLASTIDSPPARANAVSWRDFAGNLWLFGGEGYGVQGTLGCLNDLWKYTPGAGTWTWVSGSDATNANGVYGTQSTASINNVPGARFGAVSWTDNSGNLWLFGGQGYGSTATVGYLSDLWEYIPSAGTWIWMGGSNATNFHGTIGTPGTESASNAPGARLGAVSWTDSSGNLWLFGGTGYNGGASAAGLLNDLWEYSASSVAGAAGTWTRVGGTKVVDAAGVYGTLGIASPRNAPGARVLGVSWTDSSGNFWLFGGQGFAATGAVGTLNDLWKYIPSAATWIWVGGSNMTGAKGVYGTSNAASTNNVPGARSDASSWADASGNLWLFGGTGYDSNGTQGKLNDLWEYAPGSTAGAVGTWNWIDGSNLVNAATVHGKTTVPVLTFFIPSIISPTQVPGAGASFAQLALVGTYPHETVFGTNGFYLWGMPPTGGAAAFSPVSGNANAGAGVVLGPDGALWFPVSLKNNVAGTPFQVARIDASSGNETDYPFSASAQPTGIAVGPDKNLWITTKSGTVASIGQMTTSATIGAKTFYPVQTVTKGPYGPVSMVLGPAIVSGPNSALWFIETQTQQNASGMITYQYYLGEISTTGQVSSFALPNTFTPTTSNAGIAAGSDGNLWIAGTENANSQTAACGLLQVTPPSPSSASGFLSVFYQIPNNAYCAQSVAAGPDNAIWGSLLSSTVVIPSTIVPPPPALLRMTTSGLVSYVPIPRQPLYASQPGGSCTLTWDSGNILWFDVCQVYSTSGTTTSIGNQEAFIGRYQLQ